VRKPRLLAFPFFQSFSQSIVLSFHFSSGRIFNFFHIFDYANLEQQGSGTKVCCGIRRCNLARQRCQILHCLIFLHRNLICSTDHVKFQKYSALASISPFRSVENYLGWSMYFVARGQYTNHTSQATHFFCSHTFFVLLMAR
jgi:hypothetical protein